MTNHESQTVAIGTKNEAKRKAVEIVMRKVWRDQKIDVIAVEAESGISAQPMNDEETITGAINRANHASRQHPEANIAIGLEGGVESNSYGMFLKGWVAVIKPGGPEVWLGHSGGIKLPTAVAEALEAGKELGPTMLQQYPELNAEFRQTAGTNGILTNGLYTRQQEFEDALRCALGSMYNEINPVNER